VTTLQESYDNCAKLAKDDSRVLDLFLRVLPRSTARHLQALWAFYWLTHQIVLDTQQDLDDRRRSLDTIRQKLFDGFHLGESDHPELKATVHTTLEKNIDQDLFSFYLDAEESDLTTKEYGTFIELMDRIEGIGAAPGLIVLPVLGLSGEKITQSARNLGMAVQFTSILRHTGRDLQRDRIYIPQEDREHFGVDIHAEHVDQNWKNLMKFEIDRAEKMHQEAEPGISALRGPIRKCVSAGTTLSHALLGTISEAQYDVFRQVPNLPNRRKAMIVTKTLARPSFLSSSRVRR